MTAILVLGMQRSGTSCLAGMLAAVGAKMPGPVIRNWDNARGHFEPLAAVRLNDAVLATSGGHWLSPPEQVRWEPHHAGERDALLFSDFTTVIKDPRTLLCLSFWRASEIPFHSIGIIRHPLSVARSLEAWRGMPLTESLLLWIAHNQALLADIQNHDYPLIDFDAPLPELVAAVADACPSLGLIANADVLLAACDEQLIHHDRAAFIASVRTSLSTL